MWWSLREYYRPQTVGQALRLLVRYGPRAAVLAGGTQLVAVHDPRIEVLVDLSVLKLDYIEKSPRQLRIGALATLQSLTCHPDVSRLAGGLVATATESAASRPLRNRATLGGTLAVNEPTSALALALLVLGAQVVLRMPNRQVMGLAEFNARRKELLSAPALISEVRVPMPPTGASGALVAVRPTLRDQPIVTAAALVACKGNILQEVRLALGGVARTPICIPAVNTGLVGKRLGEAELDQAAHAVESSIDPPTDARAGAEYRRVMAGVVAVRALRQAWVQAG